MPGCEVFPLAGMGSISSISTNKLNIPYKIIKRSIVISIAKQLELD